MNIRDDKLEGDGVTQRETPNQGGILEPKYLVFHYTAGRNAKESVDWLCNPAAAASAHLVVGRDGKVTNLVPFNVKAWHAGKSNWEGLSGLNQYSIGIEMDNAGKLTKVGTKYRAWFQTEYPEEEVIRAKHKFENDFSNWHAYTAVQIERVLELSSILVKKYSLKDIIGHEDIAQGRKSDPGPAFPLANIKAKIFGRPEDAAEVYEVIIDSLNIRKGPGVEYEIASSPLLRGMKVALLEKQDRWSKVDVTGPNDIEGWVNNKYLKIIQV